MTFLVEKRRELYKQLLGVNLKSLSLVLDFKTGNFSCSQERSHPYWTITAQGHSTLAGGGGRRLVETLTTPKINRIFLLSFFLRPSVKRFYSMLLKGTFSELSQKRANKSVGLEARTFILRS